MREMIQTLVLAAFLALPMPTFAQSARTEGEVRKVDKEAQKVTIRHGPLREFDMPGMTMVFRVKEPGMLERLKAGDRIAFTTEKLGGAFTVTGIEPLP